MDYDLLIVGVPLIASIAIAVIKGIQAGNLAGALDSIIQGIEYIELPKNATPEETRAAIKRNIERISSRMNTGKTIDKRVKKITQPNVLVEDEKKAA